MRLSERAAGAVWLAAVLCFGCCAWITTFNRIGWIRDDHLCVYGQPARPVPSFHDIIRDAGFGIELPHPTLVRVMALAFGGYAGLWLGPVGAHLLLGVMHLACGATFYLVLRRLKWMSATAAWATAFFVVSPWIHEPIFWWSGGAVAIPSTLLGLFAILSYLHWRDGRSRWWLGLTLLLIFLSNCWYELWLGMPLLMLAIEMFCRCRDGQMGRQILSNAIRRCWPTAIPAALWAIAAHFTFPDRKPAFPPSRWIPVFLSVQLRVFNWVSTIPWRSALTDGLHTLASPAGIFMLIVTLAIAGAAWLGSAKTEENDPMPAPLAQVFLLGWMWFMSARIVLVLQGGIDVWTRHNYPANMGIALVVAASAQAAGSRGPSARQAVRILFCTVLLVCLIATAGLGQWYAGMSVEEQSMPMDQILIRIKESAQTRLDHLRWSDTPSCSHCSTSRLRSFTVASIS